MEFTLTFVYRLLFGLYLSAPVLLMLVLIVVAIGLFVGRRESWNPGDALYWSFITASTVGYGDMRPRRRLSKFLSIVIAFVGLIFTGIVVAIAVNSLGVAFDKHIDLNEVKALMQDLEK